MVGRDGNHDRTRTRSSSVFIRRRRVYYSGDNAIRSSSAVFVLFSRSISFSEVGIKLEKCLVSKVHC